MTNTNENGKEDNGENVKELLNDCIFIYLLLKLF
jgi:hypothetical protein